MRSRLRHQIASVGCLIALLCALCLPGCTSQAAGVGFTHFAITPTTPDTEAARVSAPGLALHTRSAYQINERFDLGSSLTWGLSNFSRFMDMVDAGTATANATTDAYVSVHEWATEDEDQKGLRGLGALFAYLFMWPGYAAAGILYMMAPLAPTTFVQLDATAAVHFGRGELDAMVEAGVGALTFFPDDANDEATIVGLGFGPLIGVGARYGDVTLNARVTWSPPGGNTLGGAHVYSTTITLGLDLDDPDEAADASALDDAEPLDGANADEARDVERVD